MISLLFPAFGVCIDTEWYFTVISCFSWSDKILEIETVMNRVPLLLGHFLTLKIQYYDV